MECHIELRFLKKRIKNVKLSSAVLSNVEFYTDII